VAEHEKFSALAADPSSRAHFSHTFAETLLKKPLAPIAQVAPSYGDLETHFYY